MGEFLQRANAQAKVFKFSKDEPVVYYAALVSIQSHADVEWTHPPNFFDPVKFKFLRLRHENATTTRFWHSDFLCRGKGAETHKGIITKTEEGWEIKLATDHKGVICQKCCNLRNQISRYKRYLEDLKKGWFPWVFQDMDEFPILSEEYSFTAFFGLIKARPRYACVLGLAKIIDEMEKEYIELDKSRDLF
jgi:hypothetical protein